MFFLWISHRYYLAQVVTVTEITDSGQDILFTVETFINHGSDNSNFRILLIKSSNALRSSNEVNEDDILLLDATVEEDLDGEGGGGAGREHGVEEHHGGGGEVLRELRVEELGGLGGGRLIALDEDLADLDVADGGAEGGLHGLAGAHHGDADDLLGELQTLEAVAGGGSNALLLIRDSLEGELDDGADKLVGIEEEVGT